MVATQVQRDPDFFDRRWLDEGPTQSMASVLAICEKGYGILSLSDGSSSVTIDFFFSTPEERERAARKVAAIQAVVDEFSTRIRQGAGDKTPDDSGVSIRITP